MMVLLVVLALMTGACDDNNDLEVDVNGSHPVGVVIS